MGRPKYMMGRGLTVKPKMLCRSVFPEHTMEKVADLFSLLILRPEKKENSSRIHTVHASQRFRVGLGE